MGDDRPYVYDGLLELPVHWSLDDWPHLHWKPGRGRRVHRAGGVPGHVAGGVRLRPRATAGTSRTRCIPR